jgi:hypothetical protein
MQEASSANMPSGGACNLGGIFELSRCYFTCFFDRENDLQLSPTLRRWPSQKNSQQSAVKNQQSPASRHCRRKPTARRNSHVLLCKKYSAAPCAAASLRVPLTCSHWPRSHVGLPRPRPFPAARRIPIRLAQNLTITGTVCLSQESRNCD